VKHKVAPQFPQNRNHAITAFDDFAGPPLIPREHEIVQCLGVSDRALGVCESTN